MGDHTKIIVVAPDDLGDSQISDSKFAGVKVMNFMMNYKIN